LIQVNLPLAQSVNQMYRFDPRSKRMYKTKEAKAFEQLARKTIMASSGDQSLPKERHYSMAKNRVGPFQLDLWFYFPDTKTLRDADNYVKATQDVVAKAFKFNDAEILDVFSHKRIDEKRPRCEVTLIEATDLKWTILQHYMHENNLGGAR
jgi:Holliday junction resolvase RusA-like endonuclease